MTRNAPRRGLTERTFRVNLSGSRARDLDGLAVRLNCSPDVLAEALLLIGLRQCSNTAVQFVQNYVRTAAAFHNSDQSRKPEGGAA